MPIVKQQHHQADCPLVHLILGENSEQNKKGVIKAKVRRSHFFRKK